MTPAKKVAILQSNYIPWKGYFDILNMVDVFVILDDVQYTKNDWRNRNRIQSKNGPQWLTVPVLTNGVSEQRINEARIKTNVNWERKHWQAIQLNYSKAPCFQAYKELVEETLMSQKWEFLSELNQELILRIASALGISTKIVRIEDLDLVLKEPAGDRRRTERVISITKAVGGNFYLSGPAARDYIQTEMFESAEVELAYMDYSGYPEYQQLHTDFEHSVSVLDLLFMKGESAPEYIWGWRTNPIR